MRCRLLSILSCSVRRPLLWLLLVSCTEPGADCGTLIELDCRGDGTCYCAAGPREGETCLPDTVAAPDDAASCEVVCLYCGVEELPGPRSVLLGF